jgi:hypothetical protein
MEGLSDAIAREAPHIEPLLRTRGLNFVSIFSHLCEKIDLVFEPSREGAGYFTLWLL